MAQDITFEFLSHPLTTESFDRTPEQRAVRSRIVAKLALEGVTGEAASSEANRLCFIAFGHEIGTLLHQRTTDLIGDAVSVREHPPVDLATEQLRARMQIAEELDVVNGLMPFPGLERAQRDFSGSEA